MSEMNSLTLNGKTYDCFVDDVARSSVVICSASGESIAVSDSSGQPFVGLNLYGKSTQAGTPTPDAPVDIVSVGDDGVVSVIIYGKNLVNLESGGYANASGIAYDMASYQRTTKFHLPKGMKVVWRDSNGTKPTDVLQWKENGEYIGSYNYEDGGFEAASSDAYWLAINYYLGSRTKLTWCQLEFGNVATIPVAYVIPQSMGVTGVLRGIPVADKSVATYTDASGQMWCADEIDFERGVRVQRVKLKRVTSDLTWHYSDVTQRFYALDTDFETKNTFVAVNAMCTHFKSNSNSTLDDLEMTFINDTSNGYAYQYNALNGDVSLWRNFLSENEVFVAGVLATPIETALTDDEIAAFEALHTNKPSTTVLNDSGAFMSVKYIADVKSYIDNKVSGILTATVE